MVNVVMGEFIRLLGSVSIEDSSDSYMSAVSTTAYVESGSPLRIGFSTLTVDLLVFTLSTSALLDWLAFISMGLS